VFHQRDPGEGQHTADDGERAGDFPQNHPADEDGEDRHGIERAGGDRGWGALQHVSPSQVGDGGGKHAEVHHRERRLQRRMADCRAQARQEWQQEQRTRQNQVRGEISDVIGPQIALLQRDRDTGCEGGDHHQKGAAVEVHSAFFTDGDEKHTRKAGDDTYPPPDTQALVQHDPCRQGGEDRGRGYQHAGRAAGHRPLAGVERHVVDGDADKAGHQNIGKVFARGRPHAGDDGVQQDGRRGRQEAQQRQVRRRVGGEPHANADESRSPQRHADEQGKPATGCELVGHPSLDDTKEATDSYGLRD